MATVTTKDVEDLLHDSKQWLLGNRSTCNDIYALTEYRGQAIAFTAMADAAETQRAYWILKAHKEGLVE